MTRPPEESDPAEKIEQESAAWVLRQDRGLTGAEQDQLSEWLAADARHGAALARHRQNWERLDQLVQWRPEHTGQPNRDLLAPRSPLGWPQRHPWLVGFALAAAAGISAIFLARSPFAPNSPAALAVSSAPAAAVEEHTLEDGSVVTLNRGAAFAVAFTPAERRVQLDRGEAHFTVAAHPERPFVVTVAGVDVRALGTQFDVKLAPDEIDVLVNEGRVGVGPIPLVQAGEKAVIPLGTGAGRPTLAAISGPEMDEQLKWCPLMQEFTGAPLAEVVAVFNRHNTVQLVIADPALADIRLSARLNPGNLEAFVRQLKRGFDVEAERAGNTIRLRKAP